jgi:hypothetical protein
MFTEADTEEANDIKATAVVNFIISKVTLMEHKKTQRVCCMGQFGTYEPHHAIKNYNEGKRSDSR